MLMFMRMLIQACAHELIDRLHLHHIILYAYKDVCLCDKRQRQPRQMKALEAEALDNSTDGCVCGRWLCLMFNNKQQCIRCNGQARGQLLSSTRLPIRTHRHRHANYENEYEKVGIAECKRK